MRPVTTRSSLAVPCVLSLSLPPSAVRWTFRPDAPPRVSAWTWSPRPAAARPLAAPSFHNAGGLGPYGFPEPELGLAPPPPCKRPDPERWRVCRQLPSGQGLSCDLGGRPGPCPRRSRANVHDLPRSASFPCDEACFPSYSSFQKCFLFLITFG